MAGPPSFVVINLDRDADRLAHMQREFDKAGLAFQRFSAAKGAALPEELKAFFPYANDAARSFLTPGETGCYASHLAICQMIVAGEIAAPVVVLEDDVELPPDFGALLDGVLQSVPNGWDIVRLTNDSKQIAAPIARVGAHRVVRYTNIPGSTGGLMWSRAGAEKFLAAEPRALPVDQDLRRAWHWKLETYGVLPAPVRRDVFDTSSIDAMTGSGAGHRSKKKRQAHLRAERRREAGARFSHGVRTFGAMRWIAAETLSALIALAPKRQRPALLARTGAWFADK